jgi:hypothetical protein
MLYLLGKADYRVVGTDIRPCVLTSTRLMKKIIHTIVDRFQSFKKVQIVYDTESGNGSWYTELIG